MAVSQDFYAKTRRKRLHAQIDGIFNEYKANEAKRETDEYVEWDEDVFTGFGERL